MKKLVAIAIAGLALIAAGCGGQRGGAEAAETTSEKREQALLAFAQCMRSHGIDVPDPTTDSNGNLVLRRVQGRSGRPGNDSKERTAERQCRKHLEGAAQQFTPEQRAEMQDRMVKFAECMRSKGIDMPDPDFSQGGATFRQRIRGSGVNPQDPKFRAAQDECRESVFAGQEGPGRGGIINFGPRG